MSKNIASIDKEFFCFGHRGAMGYAPENTLLSVQKALDLGVDGIEIDVYFVDNELLVFHDSRLERTTNGEGYIQEKTLGYLRSLNAGQGEKIPTLQEVFALVDKSVVINIELKGFATADPVVQFIHKQIALGWHYDSIIVSSFNHRLLRRVKELDEKIMIGALCVGLPVDNAKFAEVLKAYSVKVEKDFIDQEMVDDAHRRGLKIFVFTVNEVDEANRLKALGVDGVFSDYPDKIS